MNHDLSFFRLTIMDGLDYFLHNSRERDGRLFLVRRVLMPVDDLLVVRWIIHVAPLRPEGFAKQLNCTLRMTPAKVRASYPYSFM